MELLSIPGLPAPAQLVRRLPRSGRWRLRIPNLRGHEAEVRSALHALPGVTSVEVDGRSGRALVRAEGDTLRRFRVARRGDGRVAARGEEVPWHALAVDETRRRLRATAGGLASEEAARRLRAHGANLMEAPVTRSRWRLFRDQLANVQSALLGGAASLSVALGEWIDVGAILSVLGVNAGIGYSLERRSEALLASWRRAESGSARVLRDGRLGSVPADELVPGDLVLLSAGDVLPADARVLQARRLSCDEAPLTGESEPQVKSPIPVAEEAPLAERTSMVWSGTTVVTGRGRAIVVATGRGTEVARIGALLSDSKEPQTPLERRMGALGRRVAGVAFGGAGVSLAAGLLRGRPVVEALRTAVALGLAALPEGLPVVSTAALVRAMGRMRARGVVVRRLASAETLGGVTVICCDKTGTLTRNEMRLEVVEAGDQRFELDQLRFREARLFDDRVSLLLLGVVLNSEVELMRDALSGSSTEQALLVAARRAGADPARLRKKFPMRLLRERTRGVNYVVSVHDRPDGGAIALVKGAPEQVLALCSRDGEGPLDRARILRRNDELAADALRVLALAWQPLEDASRGYRYLGMVGLRDPVRVGAAAAVEGARKAGIRTLIVTGDQRRTAEAVARAVGLSGVTLDAAEAVRRVRAGELDLMELAALSRAAPADKLALVELLRRRGEIVAMAGDGFNDAPALKVADVGIAVGQNASDLSRQVADVVLIDSDLRAILAAVAEGRIVQDNLRRAIRFLFATNLSEMALVLGAALAGLPAPLTPLQLLWINMLTDTLPALALALEPGDPRVLGRPPAPPSAPLLSRPMLRRIARDGLGMAALGAIGGAVGGRPLAFGALTGAQLSYTAACRAPDAPRGSGFGNVMGGTIALQAAALLLPGVRRLLGAGGSPGLALAGLGVGLAVPLVLRAASEEIVRINPREES